MHINLKWSLRKKNFKDIYQNLMIFCTRISNLQLNLQCMCIILGTNFKEIRKRVLAKDASWLLNEVCPLYMYSVHIHLYIHPLTIFLLHIIFAHVLWKMILLKFKLVLSCFLIPWSSPLFEKVKSMLSVLNSFRIRVKMVTKLFLFTLYLF